MIYFLKDGYRIIGVHHKIIKYYSLIKNDFDKNFNINDYLYKDIIFKKNLIYSK